MFISYLIGNIIIIIVTILKYLLPHFRNYEGRIRITIRNYINFIFNSTGAETGLTLNGCLPTTTRGQEYRCRDPGWTTNTGCVA